jgi:hypothetical protein
VRSSAAPRWPPPAGAPADPPRESRAAVPRGRPCKPRHAMPLSLGDLSNVKIWNRELLAIKTGTTSHGTCPVPAVGWTPCRCRGLLFPRSSRGSKKRTGRRRSNVCESDRCRRGNHGIRRRDAKRPRRPPGFDGPCARSRASSPPVCGRKFSEHRRPVQTLYTDAAAAARERGAPPESNGMDGRRPLGDRRRGQEGRDVSPRGRAATQRHRRKWLALVNGCG